MLRCEVDKVSRFGQNGIKFLFLLKLEVSCHLSEVRLRLNSFRLRLNERKACNVIFGCNFYVSNNPNGLCFSGMNFMKLVHRTLLFSSLH